MSGANFTRSLFILLLLSGLTFVTASLRHLFLRRDSAGRVSRNQDGNATGIGAKPPASCSFPRGCSPEVKEDGGV